MSRNPIVLTVIFLLELAGLVAMGYWGWTRHEGLMRFVWTIGLPVAAAAIWGVFRVEGDPGHAPVAVHGVVRLLLEIAYFALAVWLLVLAAAPAAALILGAVALVDYALSYDRILRMIRNEKPLPVDWGKLKI